MKTGKKIKYCSFFILQNQLFSDDQADTKRTLGLTGRFYYEMVFDMGVRLCVGLLITHG